MSKIMCSFNRLISRALLFTCLIFVGQLTWADDSSKIENIEVQGLQRISQGTVFSYLPVKTGDSFNGLNTGQIMHSLYGTGFFNDIELQRDGSTLLIQVKERPSIADITPTGNNEIRTEDLLEALKKSGLSKGKIFDRSLLDKIKQDLQQQYFMLGYYAVEIDTSISTMPDNLVNVQLVIREGDVAKIKQINLIGSEAFDEDDLLDQFELGIPAFYSFFSDSDQYSKPKLSADLETLKSYYLNRGYINFNVQSTQVSITPNKNSVFIAINIDEGSQYRISSINIAGALVVSEQELHELITIEEGSIFSRRSINEVSSVLNERLGEEGYAFANVNAVPEINEESKTVSLTYFIDPGKRVYVRRININGNEKTEDEVIRRELRQMEGAWLSTSKLNRSQIRVQRLKYIENVSLETPMVAGSSDQVDVNMTLSERPSGSLMLGIGYSDGDGMLLNASVSQDNFLGSGERVSAEINTSKVNKIYSFSHTNPYYTLDGVSRSIRLFYRETDAAEANLANYIADSKGLSVSYGIPLSEYNTARIGFGYEDTIIKTTAATPTAYLNFITANSNEFDVFKLTLGWSHDTRNRTIFATEGVMQSLTLEGGIPASGIHFYKISSRSQWYYPLSDYFTTLLRGQLNYGDSYKNTTDLPFFEKFYAGGAHSVRGYRANSLGPRDNSVNLGGNFRVIANAEVLFPPPFSPESSTVRTSLFMDIGNVFSDTDSFETSELRRSAGVALIWLSPIGPLAFSFSEPLNNQIDDETETFQFTLGSSFF